MIPFEWFEVAEQRIRSHIKRTPLTRDDRMQLYLKWENHQITGSFKARGALNKVLSLEAWEREAGLVAASAGNHGQGVALAGRMTGSPVDVFVPRNAVTTKVAAIRDLGGQVHLVEGGYGEAETAARGYAAHQSRTFVSPYNDGQVIAGQGTIAFEVLDQLQSEFGVAPQEIGAWIVPTGGGGLISGVGEVLRQLAGMTPRLLGVQPKESAFTYSLFHRHTQTDVQDRPTLADGLSGAIDENSITIPMMRELVDDLLIVPEDSIRNAIGWAWRTYRDKIEGSAAVALAAVLDALVPERPCVVILTGGNIDTATLESILAQLGVRRPL